MPRAVITGAPGAGKSSLIQALAERGVAVHREVARDILQSPGGMDLRERDPQGFARAMLDAQVQLFEGAGDDVVVFDRGFPDIAGFLTVSGCAVPEEIDTICRQRRFDGPIFHARPWREIYTPDEERIQTWEEAIESDAAVASAWQEYGYSLVALPYAPIEERVDFVLDRIAKGR